MRDGLLLAERLILESLQSGMKTAEELVADTGLKKNLLMSLLSNLFNDYIVIQKGVYFDLNYENKEDWIDRVNSRESVKGEVKELFLAMINQFFEELEERSCGLKMKKIYVNEKDEKILQAHFKNLDSFVENLEKYPHDKDPKPTHSKKVIFWGQSDYGALVENSLIAC